MRDFIISDITGGNKAPFSKRSLEHLNEMTSELGSSMFQGLVDYQSFGTEFVIMTGVTISGSFPGAITWTAGIVYYQGDFYQVDAGGTTIAVGQTAVWNYADTTITGDPATFSDTNTYDFHRIRKMTLSSGASGSGLKNYNSVKLYTKTSTNAFGANNNAGVVSGATISTQLFIRRGNRVDFCMAVSVTTSSADTFALDIPITNNDDYPANDTIYYGTTFANCGSVAPVGGTLSGNLINGAVRAQYNGRIIVTVYRTNATTSHDIQIFGSYFTEAPYSPY